MKITRTARWVDGEIVYDPPFTPEEIAEQRARFREMLNARQPPGTKGTDRAFLQDRHDECGFTEGPEWLKNMVVERAHAAGIKTYGKVYAPGLCNSLGPQDPRAWISDTHEFRKVAEERNLTCQGAVEHKGREVEPPKDVQLAPHLLKKIDDDYGRQDPNWKKKHPQERKEAIIDCHGAPAKGRGFRKVI